LRLKIWLNKRTERLSFEFCLLFLLFQMNKWYCRADANDVFNKPSDNWNSYLFRLDVLMVMKRSKFKRRCYCRDACQQTLFALHGNIVSLKRLKHARVNCFNYYFDWHNNVARKVIGCLCKYYMKESIGMRLRITSTFEI